MRAFHRFGASYIDGSEAFFHDIAVVVTEGTEALRTLKVLIQVARSFHVLPGAFIHRADYRISYPQVHPAEKKT